MTFKRLSCLLLIVTCFFIAGCDFLEPTDSKPPPVTVTGPEEEKPLTPEMVLIPAGEFRRGSNNGQEDERPVHTVYVDAFYMDKYEVTNAQFQKFVLANPDWDKGRIADRYYDGDYLQHWTGNDYPSEKANHPVVYVSWYAAMAYAQWAEKRLPTEAEWEYAARGGLEGKKYPWGDGIDSGKANYAANVGDTTPVDRYPPNGYGLHDMAGNVWEWCLDQYDHDFYSVSRRKNPIGGPYTINWFRFIDNFTRVKTSRVTRGGGWRSGPTALRVADRNYGSPELTSWTEFGFRCVRAQ